MEFEYWFEEFSVLQIAGMIALILIFLLVFFKAIWLIIKYMRNYNDER
ncbi:MAG TPA: hypothetical protein PLC80_02870 [Draconibacterium sp.]|nr:hypothetical protein [Draconibacterium sp.]